MPENTKHVLLVASHDLMARALHRGLEEEGFTVQIISNSDFDAASVRHIRADVLLIDVSPWEDIAELSRQWKGITRPLLALTTPDQRARMDANGNGVSMLTKPFAYESLVKRLKSLTA